MARFPALALAALLLCCAAAGGAAANAPPLEATTTKNATSAPLPSPRPAAKPNATAVAAPAKAAPAPPVAKPPPYWEVNATRASVSPSLSVPAKAAPAPPADEPEAPPPKNVTAPAAPKAAAAEAPPAKPAAPIASPSPSLVRKAAPEPDAPPAKPPAKPPVAETPPAEPPLAPPPPAQAAKPPAKPPAATPSPSPKAAPAKAPQTAASERPTALAVLRASPLLNTSRYVLEAGGLSDKLSDAALVATLFVPTEAAWAAFLAAAKLRRGELLANGALATKLARNMVVPHAALRTLAFEDGAKLATLNQEALTLRFTADLFVVVSARATATVIVPDLAARAAVMHVVDTVLVPDSVRVSV